jgi:uncharacterized glyoxalase superfamily protein PhnB
MPTIFPIIRFNDSDAGLAWLKDALGFEEHSVYRGEDGSIQHGELRHGDAWLMIGTEPAGGDTQPTSSAGTGDRFGKHAGTGFIYLAVDDAAASFELAQRAGANLTSEARVARVRWPRVLPPRPRGEYLVGRRVRP